MYELGYFFDAGSGICLWSGNGMAQDKFGYAVDLADLPLSMGTVHRGRALIAAFDTSVDWDNPSGPAPWSSGDSASFQTASNEFLLLLQDDLGTGFKVVDQRGKS